MRRCCHRKWLQWSRTSWKATCRSCFQNYAGSRSCHFKGRAFAIYIYNPYSTDSTWLNGLNLKDPKISEPFQQIVSPPCRTKSMQQKMLKLGRWTWAMKSRQQQCFEHRWGVSTKDVCSNIPEKEIAISSFLFHPQTRWLTWKDWRWNLVNTVVKHAVPYQFHSFIVLFRLQCGCWKNSPDSWSCVFLKAGDVILRNSWMIHIPTGNRSLTQIPWK